MTPQEKAREEECDHCGLPSSKWTNDCPMCGAPVCCPHCCQVNTLVMEKEKHLKRIDELEEDNERLETLSKNIKKDYSDYLHKKGKEITRSSNLLIKNIKLDAENKNLKDALKAVKARIADLIPDENYNGNPEEDWERLMEFNLPQLHDYILRKLKALDEMEEK